MNERDMNALLKLADLIDEGAKTHSQIKGAYTTEDKKGCCALGAAVYATGRKEIYGLQSLKRVMAIDSFPTVQMGADIIEEYSKIDVSEQHWIDDPSVPMTVDGAVIFLNDKLGWSFAQISAWVRAQAKPD